MSLTNVGNVKTIKISDEYEMVIVEDKWNPLIERREIKGVIYHMGKGTPKRYVVREAVAKALNVPIDQVYVRKVETKFGISETEAIIHVYSSPERAKKFEPPHIIRRNQPEKKKEGE